MHFISRLQAWKLNFTYIFYLPVLLLGIGFLSKNMMLLIFNSTQIFLIFMLSGIIYLGISLVLLFKFPDLFGIDLKDLETIINKGKKLLTELKTEQLVEIKSS